MTFAAFAPLKPTERIMIFIDGGYVRKTYTELFGNDNIDYGKLLSGLVQFYEAAPSNIFRPNLIRAYYYDAVVDENARERTQQMRYFTKVTRNFSYTVRLGHLVRLENDKFRQKGVDVLMAVDALTKAYLDHYDVGVFFLGDRDFIPLIEAVKNTGKKTFGFYFGVPSPGGTLESKVPVDLGKVFDVRIALPKETLEQWCLKEENVH